MKKKVSIVVTTIFEPRFLDGYLANLDAHGWRESVDIIVIIDRKTPATVAAACADAARRGFRVTCPSLHEQERFLGRFGTMSDRIPYDSDNRRNVGFLMALDQGTEVLISIDDDNYCIDGTDFVGQHSVVGEAVEAAPIESSDRWFNVGTRLHTDVGAEIFPRGFPYHARRLQRTLRLGTTGPARVAMNAGLWLSDPDVDAISRLALGPQVRAADDESLFLATSTWSPINTQNTAVARDAVAAYYYVRMGFSLGGLSIDRFGDILSGYFCQACVKARGESIRIGPPIADHRRTPHNLFKDLYHELAGIVILEDLLPWLLDLKLPSARYDEIYLALADALEHRAAAFNGFIWDQGGDAFLRQTASHMRAWIEAVRQIG